jgi:hypothetical protein
MINWKEKYKQFKAWQQQPYQVKPLSEQMHVCKTCGTSFEGNYCPRCGQSSKIGRYSAKDAFLLFLEVWGLGNRGMFRTLRDLILRPGYMIRDYLQGMQMAYFPPFKMFFLLVALEMLVLTGMNIDGTNRIDENLKRIDQIERSITEQGNTNNTKQETDQTAVFHVVKKMTTWAYQHSTLVTLVFLLFFSIPLYWFFRHSPNIPDMRFSEFFVAVIYFMNMTSIYSIVYSFFSENIQNETFISLLAIIPLKQLTGYSYWLTIWKTFLALILFFLIALLIGGIYGGVSFLIGWPN